MNIYVWNDLGDVTDSYHSSGGVLVIAPSLEAAVAALPRIPWKGQQPAPVEHPDLVLALADGAENCFVTLPFVQVFPNRGCC